MDAPTDFRLDNVPYPSGTLHFDFDVNGHSGCSYTGTSNAPGTLDCPDFMHPVECIEDASAKDKYHYDQSLVVFDTVPKVYCAWN